jgi:hypothetical protein
MDKIIHLDEYFPTGEMTVQPVMLWANNKACYESITKHASVGTEYFKTIQPVPGHSFVYVLAVSDWEHYGDFLTRLLSLWRVLLGLAKLKLCLTGTTLSNRLEIVFCIMRTLTH